MIFPFVLMLNDTIYFVGIDYAPFAVYNQPVHPENVKNDDDDFCMFVGFWTWDLSMFLLQN